MEENQQISIGGHQQDFLSQMRPSKVKSVKISPLFQGHQLQVPGEGHQERVQNLAEREREREIIDGHHLNIKTTSSQAQVYVWRAMSVTPKHTHSQPINLRAVIAADLC